MYTVSTYAYDTKGCNIGLKQPVPADDAAVLERCDELVICGRRVATEVPARARQAQARPGVFLQCRTDLIQTHG